MGQRSRIPVGPPIPHPLPSYWQHPPSPLAAVIEPETEPSKANQPPTYDYAIIGSGISGAALAFHLLNTHPSSRVVLLDARTLCSGATGRNGGHTKAASYRSYVQNVRELGVQEALRIARLEYANIVETHRLARELGIECESEFCETVDAIYDPETFEAGKEAIEALRGDVEDGEKEEKRGMGWYEIHEKEHVWLQKEGRFVASQNKNFVLAGEEERLEGVFRYLAGRIHAYRFTMGMLKVCVERGLRLCANTPVHAIRPTASTSASHTTSSDPPAWEVFTQYSTISATRVVLATNGYTPYLAPEFQGAIVPLRGQITAQRPGRVTKLTNPLPTTYSFIYKNGYEYMVPRIKSDKGQITQDLIVGGGLGRLPAQVRAGEYGTVDDGSVNPMLSKYLRESLVGYFGAETWGESRKDTDKYDAKDTEEENVESSRVVQEWTGIMGATADGRPFVGEVPGKKGLWVSAGFNGHGMVLCLKCAEAVVEMMGEAGKRPEWFPQSFVVTRERLGKIGEAKWS